MNVKFPKPAIISRVTYNLNKLIKYIFVNCFDVVTVDDTEVITTPKVVVTNDTQTDLKDKNRLVTATIPGNFATFGTEKFKQKNWEIKRKNMN